MGVIPLPAAKATIVLSVSFNPKLPSGFEMCSKSPTCNERTKNVDTFPFSMAFTPIESCSVGPEQIE